MSYEVTGRRVLDSNTLSDTLTSACPNFLDFFVDKCGIVIQNHL